MRGISIIAFALTVAACTANVSITKVPISQRVADACADTATLCSATGNCLAQQAFCGADGRQFVGLFAAEDACKSSCNDATSCIKTCKITRMSAIDSYLSVADLDGNGIAGDGTGACASLDTTCGQTGQGCTADEFFCGTTARVVDSPCATQLAQCKAACAPHDRTCTRMCREQYRQCLASGSSPDAGVPDAPAPDAPMPDAGTPDAPPPPPTTYNLTYGTTAGSTGTGTVTVNPAGTSCGSLCATYVSGTTVTLTATASNGSTFTKWTGCTSTTNTCTVTVTKALTVTATFTLNPPTTSYTYTTDIAPKMTGLCNGCHSGGSAPAGYLTDSYTGLFGNGSDNTPNIIAGDGNSLFVQKIAGNHHNVLNQYPGFDKVAHDWVVLNNAVK